MVLRASGGRTEEEARERVQAPARLDTVLRGQHRLRARKTHVKGSGNTGDDHADVGDRDEDDVNARQAGEEREVEKQERGRAEPVGVTGPVDLAGGVLARGVNDAATAAGRLSNQRVRRNERRRTMT